MIEQKQIVLNGHLVNYYHARGAGHDAIIFLHGWRSEGSVFEKILKALGGKIWNLYSLDFPGFGKSETPRTHFALDDYAGIIKEFVEKLGLKNITLVGHSFGGRVALKIAAAKPRWLKKLILANSAGLRLREKTLQKIIAKILKPFFVLPFMKRLRENIYRWIGAEDYIATPHLKETFLSTIKEDLTPLLHQIQHATLLIWGEDDKDTPLALANIMKEKIPNSRLVILPNAGHYSFLDQTENFLKEVLNFLSQTPSSSS